MPLQALRLIAGALAVGMLLGCSRQAPPEQAEPEAADLSAQQPDVAAVPKYDAETFFLTTTFQMPPSAGHAFSPDGTELLVSSDESGVFNAYALPVDGQPMRELSASSDEAIQVASWFPADRRVLYQFDEGGNELDHVYVRELDGSARDLTPGKELKAQFAGWQRDGGAFYLLTTERDGRSFDLYRYDARDYTRVLVYENPGLQPAAVSPDGRWLALDKPRTSADSDVYLVDLQAAQAEPRLITPHDGNVTHTALEFTPDSKTLVYLTDEHGEFMQAWSYDLASGSRAPLVQADWDVLYVTHSPSGRYRVVGINADGSTEVSILDTGTGSSLELPDLPQGDLGSVRFSADEASMALLVSSSVAPSNVHVVDLASKRQRQLTDALNPAIDPAHLVEARVVRFPSYDGLEIPGILYRPHGASAQSPAPALVWVHGGPGGQSRAGYSATLQHLVNHGYAVFAVNNRGSSGYGKTFFHLDDRKHGEADLGDVVEARHYLAGLDWVDGQRIGIIGGSYGGYMVVAALAFEPEVFDVGIDIFGVTNWLRTLESIPPWWESFKEALYDEMGDPATDRERLERISALFHADQIRVPLLVVQGANDPRVLQVESDEMVAAVRANEVPVEYIVFPDEGHGFAKRENRITASNAYVRFLDAYL